MAGLQGDGRRADQGALDIGGGSVYAAQEALSAHQIDTLFIDDAIQSIESRALAYLAAGAAVHLRGPAGIGKTTLALLIAQRRGRPVVLVTGDGWSTAASLIGDHVGRRSSSVRDKYIHNVVKTESETTALWEDRALTIAMERGWTLVYDEFTRSPAEANNPLLTALEERMIVLPTGARAKRIVKAHEAFRAVFTSNPSDYAAVKTPADALLDRMITFDLGWMSAETETGVVARRSGLSLAEASRIVDLVRRLRGERSLAHPPSMRSAILIARVAARIGAEASVTDERFVQLCFDVLESRAPSELDKAEARERAFNALRGALSAACPPKPAPPFAPPAIEETAA